MALDSTSGNYASVTLDVMNHAPIGLAALRSNQSIKGVQSIHQNTLLSWLVF